MKIMSILFRKQISFQVHAFSIRLFMSTYRKNMDLKAWLIVYDDNIEKNSI